MIKFWRHESRLNFWPAYVDLMVVLAVVGLISAAGYKISLERGSSNIQKWITQRQKVDRVINNLHQELTKSNIHVIEQPDGVRLPESLLKFDSGKVKPIMDEYSENTFRKICLAIKNSFDKIPGGNQDLIIVFEGHTDSQEIGPELAMYYPTNWELSAARATYVLRIMSSSFYGLNPDYYQMRAIGFGDKQPIENGKIISQANRRIEIKILPNYEKIEEVGLK